MMNKKKVEQLQNSNTGSISCMPDTGTAFVLTIDIAEEATLLEALSGKLAASNLLGFGLDWIVMRLEIFPACPPLGGPRQAGVCLVEWLVVGFGWLQSPHLAGTWKAVASLCLLAAGGPG